MLIDAAPVDAAPGAGNPPDPVREVVSESTVARDQGVKRQDYDRANTGSAAPSRGAWYPRCLWTARHCGKPATAERDRAKSRTDAIQARNRALQL